MNIKKLFLISVILITGCGTIIGGSGNNDITGPSEIENLISYDDIKSNYESLSSSDFDNYIKTVGEVEWRGTVNNVYNGEKTVELYITSPANLLHLKTPSTNGPLIVEASKQFGKLVTIRAKITGFLVVTNFVVLGTMEHIEVA